MTMLVVTLLSVIGGAICCFAGYRIFRVALSLIGGCLGAYVGVVAYRYLSQYDISLMHMEHSELVTVLLFAILFGALAFTLYMKALIAVVTLISGWYLYSDSESIGIKLPWSSPIITFGICLLYGLVIGFAVYYLQKWAIIIFTSFIGAKIISSVLVPYLVALISGQQGELALKILEGRISGDTELLIELISVLLLTGAGIAVQLSKKNS